MQCARIGPFFSSASNGVLQALSRSCDHFGKRHHGRRDRFDTVGNHAVRRVLDAIQHVVQRGETLWISSGSIGVIKVWFSRVKISWMTSSPRFSRTLMSVAAPARRASPIRMPSSSNARCFRDQIHLLLKQMVELLFTREQIS